MARVFRCGPGSAYGCGHHDEHVRAAKLGWLRRKLSGTAFESDDDQRHLARAVGEVKHAHTHPTHPDVIAFKQGRKWYELPRSEFTALVRAGRDMEREEAAEAKRRAREEKAIAQFRRAEQIEAKRDELARKREERYQAAQERAVRQVQRAERAEVIKLIRERGGIKATGAHDSGEVALLPKELRRKNGISLDYAREHVMEEMPWLKLDTPDDLVNFFEGSRVTRMQQSHQAAQRKKRGAA